MELMTFLTTSCNFRCPYCYVHFTNEHIDQRVLSHIISLLEDKDTLSLFGGEPLLMSETIIDTIRMLDDLKKYPEIKLFTNGSLFDSGVLKSLVDSKSRVMVQVSYDGQKQRDVTHMGNYTMDDIESHIIMYHEAFKSICSCSKQLHIEMTITPDNVDGMAVGAQRIYDLGVRSLGIVPVVEAIWSEESKKIYEDQCYSLAELMVRSYTADDRMVIGSISPYRNLNRDLNGTYGCGAGKYLFGISTTGEIWTCHRYWAQFKDKRSSYYKGNIMNVSSLDKFTLEHEIPVYDHETTKCGTCEDKNFCNRCHLANVLRNDDIKVSPDDWFCKLPAIHHRTFNLVNAFLIGQNCRSYIIDFYHAVTGTRKFDATRDDLLKIGATLV
jgi:sulfatase maturation enzyme AslB (radical SAM superfamily)